MNDHPPERVDPLLCVERKLPLADLSSGFMRRKAMISYENTKTVRDLSGIREESMPDGYFYAMRKMT